MIDVNKKRILVEDSSLKPDFSKGNDGLLPVVAQEHTPDRRGTILMVAYANYEAYRLTLETGLACFWSRSRQKLWQKGETSGYVLVIKEIWFDCDRDAIIYMVEPPEIVCHLGRASCFVRKAYEHHLTECPGSPSGKHIWVEPQVGVHQCWLHDNLQEFCQHCGKEK